ncbi:MAG: hypothetical protein IJI03_01290, partial [Rudaea sp.]|nr:hypothetical protein [Rudaea sp.]
MSVARGVEIAVVKTDDEVKIFQIIGYRRIASACRSDVTQPRYFVNFSTKTENYATIFIASRAKPAGGGEAV